MRKRYINESKVPPDHHIEIITETNTQRIEVDEVVCDFCNCTLTGKPSVAVTIFQGAEPDDWESEFGY